jgi:hypothetical protein
MLVHSARIYVIVKGQHNYQDAQIARTCLIPRLSWNILWEHIGRYITEAKINISESYK